ncbi:ABC transporter substrate-binding protein [Bradyrhizobium sp. AS23.2]|uniref:ABC transporter substrate-binding protein n=1 Tax=Bradyrhizobium sp. AS23.2 TaxID=1680155 RepID=UPI00093A79D5|nr:ABC transporter substrate-binding protein [Bradyrhizobium sp. AS23.2]OKO84558.1 hypothetical protein AC630_08590 [Bradyrhizobium sp. AS23.2]
MLSRLKGTILLTAMAALVNSGFAHARDGFSNDEVVLGILNDMTGPYSDVLGPGLVQSVQWAIDDFGGTLNGKPIKVLNADTQVKADIASTTARKWIDENKVDVLLTSAGTAITLAGIAVAKDNDVALLNAGGVSADLSNKQCNALMTHWLVDTYAAAKLSIKAGTDAGAKTWFFITADYSFGEALQRDAEVEIKRLGGKVVGSVRAPLGTTDFSSFLLQAKTSGADIVALANAGADTLNSLKQAEEFGIRKGGQNLIGLITNNTDIYGLGLPVAQGLMVTESFFYDRDEDSKAFAKRFEAKFKRYPSQNQVAAYSATLHYLRAVKEANTDSGATVNAQMKKMPVKDFYAIEGKIRDDGRMIPKYMYLLTAKKPSDAKNAFDIYNLVQAVPGDEAFRPLEASECPLVKK